MAIKPEMTKCLLLGALCAYGRVDPRLTGALSAPYETFVFFVTFVV
jgi:hypothetical protein